VREAIAFLHSGGIGELYMARALCFKARDSYGMAKDSAPPAELPLRPLARPGAVASVQREARSLQLALVLGHRQRRHRQHRPAPARHRALGTREARASGVRVFGRRIYGLRKDDGGEAHARRAMVYGGVETYGHDRRAGDAEHPDGLYTYADGTMLEMETRGRYTNHEGSAGQEVGNLFYGTEGWLEISGNTWKAFRHAANGALRRLEGRAARRQSLGELPGRASLRQARDAARRHPRRVTSRRRCATSPTSPTASAAR
jgi:hypothetical protein